MIGWSTIHSPISGANESYTSGLRERGACVVVTNHSELKTQIIIPDEAIDMHTCGPDLITPLVKPLVRTNMFMIKAHPYRPEKLVFVGM